RGLRTGAPLDWGAQPIRGIRQEHWDRAKGFEVEREVSGSNGSIEIEREASGSNGTSIEGDALGGGIWE
ncbi:MAG: hypothetical protein BJ554DRAFT_1325, partial [Olpidium bornovanus]